MNPLFNELERLYFLPDQQWLEPLSGNGSHAVGAAGGPLTPAILTRHLADGCAVTLNLLGATGCVRAMLVIFEKPADWPAVVRLYQAVQEELELPAPALSVSGRNGFRLWFSLVEPVPLESARRFLAGLRDKYLADMPAADLQFRPDIESSAAPRPALVKLTPARHRATGRWSAFIDASLGAMFAEESGLEMAPGLERQAHILASLASIGSAEFQRALALLEVPPAVSEPAASAAASAHSALGVGGTFTDPRSFLLAVMNDPLASLALRVEAARVLLPYFEAGAS